MDLGRLRAACASCSLRELCLPAGLDPQELEKLDRLVSQRRRLRKGENLYSAGMPLTALHAVRSGFLKSCVQHEDGREQVAGFHMMGDLLGLDAIGGNRHVSDAVALEDRKSVKYPSRCSSSFPGTRPACSSS